MVLDGPRLFYTNEPNKVEQAKRFLLGKGIRMQAVPSHAEPRRIDLVDINSVRVLELNYWLKESDKLIKVPY